MGTATDEDSAAPSLLRRRPPPPPPIAVSPDVDDALLEWAAGETEGFSGRELAKLVTGVRAAVYGGSGGRLLDAGLFRAIVEYKARTDRRTPSADPSLRTPQGKRATLPSAGSLAGWRVG